MMQKILERFRFQDVLAVFMLTEIMAYFFWISRPGYANPNATEIKQILGVAFGLILGFYYGSSKSSANKDEAINTAIKNQSNIVASIIVLAISIALVSCSSTHKNTSLHTKQLDSAAVTRSIGVGVSKMDSTGTKAISRVQLKDSAFFRSNGVAISFYEDSVKADKPITVIKNRDGSITVDPGGRKLKKVNITASSSGNLKDSAAGSDSQQTDLHKADSNAHDDKRKVSLQFDEKDKVKKVDKSGVSTGKLIFGAVILIVLGFIMLYVWPKKNVV